MLHPGYARQTSDGKWLLDEEAVTMSGALLDSMALKIETEFTDLYRRVEDEAMSDDFLPGLRMLFVAVARGVLGYLMDKNDEIVAEIGEPPADHAHQIPLPILWEEVDAS